MVDIPVNCLFWACGNPKLEEDTRRCKEECYRYNQLSPNDREGQLAILSRLLGSMGKDATFMPPFWCDYGYRIHVGDSFYANHNLVITDGAKVAFGDNVFVAPNCCFTTAEHALDPDQRRAGMEVAKPISVGNNVWIGAGCTVPSLPAWWPPACPAASSERSGPGTGRDIRSGRGKSGSRYNRIRYC